MVLGASLAILCDVCVILSFLNASFSGRHSPPFGNMWAHQTWLRTGIRSHTGGRSHTGFFFNIRLFLYGIPAVIRVQSWQKYSRGILSANSLPDHSGVFGTGVGILPNRHGTFNVHSGIVQYASQKSPNSGYVPQNTTLIFPLLFLVLHPPAVLASLLTARRVRRSFVPRRT